MKACAIDGCDKEPKGRGWCAMHYARWRKHGDLGPAQSTRRPPGDPAPPRQYRRADWRSDCPDRRPDLIFTTTDGYRCYRWSEGIEMLEHRFAMDPGPGLHVHHINEDKLDNRPENLEVLDPVEHLHQHRVVDRAELVRLYKELGNCSAVARRMGIHNATAYRLLLAEGVQPRSSAEVQRTPVDDARLRELHGTPGYRVPQIAAELGVGDAVVRRRMRELGLPSFVGGGRRGEPHGTGSAKDVVVRLPADLHAQVKARAEAEDRSMAALIRRALRAYCATPLPSWADPAQEAS